MTEQLVFLEPGKVNPQPFTTSEVIAEYAGVQHHTITRLLQQHETDFEEFGRVRFEIEARKTKGGTQGVKVYRLNEEQTTLLMTYLKNTEQVRAFKKEVVRQFYEMRRLLLERQSAQWQQARSESKTTRQLETAAIKAFVDYAAANGSKSAERYYVHFTSLACNALGIEKGQRNVLPASVLLNLRTVEQVIDRAIREELAAGTEYHKAFQNVKAKVGQVTALVFAPLPVLAEPELMREGR